MLLLALQDAAPQELDPIVQTLIRLLVTLETEVGTLWIALFLGVAALALAIFAVQFAAKRSRQHYLDAAAAILRRDIPGAWRALRRAWGVKHSTESPADLVDVAADLLLEDAVDGTLPQGVRTETRQEAIRLRTLADELRRSARVREGRA